MELGFTEGVAITAYLESNRSESLAIEWLLRIDHNNETRVPAVSQTAPGYALVVL